jgi:glutamate-1-semialdehyde 2,1-aminomutase
VLEAVEAACRRGMVYGGQHALEVEAAERLVDALRWPDLVRFGVSGTETVQAALRVARAATGRPRFIRFEGHYHGWLDDVLVATVDGRTGPASDGQLASRLDDSLVLPFNDADAVARLLEQRGEEIAAVILEPMMCNAGAIPPRPGFLERLRSLCDASGVVLIFDEVICGFRLALGGAAERFGVVPDLAVYGKAMAGGWPAAALAGRGDLLEPVGNGKVNHAGTFNASVMATAATAATLEQLATEPPYERIGKLGEELMAGLVELGEAHGVPLRVQGLPVAFHASFGDAAPVHDYRGVQRLDQARYARFAHALADRGVWVAPRGIWYLSTAHGEAEVERTLARVDQSLGEHAAG